MQVEVGKAQAVADNLCLALQMVAFFKWLWAGAFCFSRKRRKGINQCYAEKHAMTPLHRQTPYFTNATLFNLTALPRRFVVLGAGPISLEMAQAFRRFGSEASAVKLFTCNRLNGEQQAPRDILFSLFWMFLFEGKLAEEGSCMIDWSTYDRFRMFFSNQVPRFTRMKAENPRIGIKITKSSDFEILEIWCSHCHPRSRNDYNSI